MILSESYLQLKKKIEERSAVIGIVGMGYVGQPLALRFSEVGFKVVGLDIDETKVENLNAGHSGIEHISNSRVEQAIERGFVCTSDFRKVEDLDAVIICVPTPLNKYREPDLSYVIETCDSVSSHLRAATIVSLESTTYPGTTSEEVVPRMTSSGLAVGDQIFVVYSPEREDPGNQHFDTRSIPKVIGGETPQCLEIGSLLYSCAVDDCVPVSSTRAAELTKLLENIHRSVNIGLVNEMKILADRMGIDIYEVIDAAKTKPFGFTAYYPGPGIGGHCIPIDPFYLTWKAREYGLHTRFIELAGEINRYMPEFVVEKLVKALNARSLPLKGSKILVLGIAYKRDVDDMRESPSVHIMELLREGGASVSYSDPHVPTFPKMREHSFDLTSVELDSEKLRDFDAVILATDHKQFDYDLISSNSRLLVDTRGVWRAAAGNIIKA